MAVTSQNSDRPLVTMIMRRTNYVAMNFSSSGLKLGQHRACALSGALDLQLLGRLAHAHNRRQDARLSAIRLRRKIVLINSKV